MTITLFVEPKSLLSFLTVMSTLKDLLPDNDYVFNPCDLVFSETTISNYIRIGIDTDEYLKLQYCIGKLKSKG